MFIVRCSLIAAALIVAATVAVPRAQQAAGVSPQGLRGIRALIAEKASRTAVQRKISSRLLYAAKMARGEPITQEAARLDIQLPDSDGRSAVVDIRAEPTARLLDELTALGGELLEVSPRYRHIRLRTGLDQIEQIAALPEVTFVGPRQEAIIHVGSRLSQGDAKHKANIARALYGVSGANVKIGVLSDGVTHLADSQALGDLGPVTVLPGQAGRGDEGTAMLEVIHDLAPNAQLYFATAFSSMASFAQNIRDLRSAGCDIILDDVAYFAESPFQDGQTTTSPTNGGILIQAVKDVAAGGALYFSAAGNSGNKNDGTSGTWEGDFVDGGVAGSLFGPDAGSLHNFGGQTYNVITASTSNLITLQWADPLGGSSNDYDLFRLDSTGTTILDSSTDPQTGTQDPYESVSGGSANQRIVIVKYSGAGRFLHLATNEGRLSIATDGEIHGHAATSAPTSFAVAATSAQVNGSNAFTTNSVVETFSSDGPRRIFFQANGAAITPGNLSASGGQVLQKPDLTAADAVSVSGVGGFPTTFAGTSAAAPHAAAIAALIKSRKPGLSATLIRSAMTATAIDIEAAGVDRDAGYGIVMADAAIGTLSPRDTDFDGDGRVDLTVFRPSTGTWLSLSSTSGYTSSTSRQWGLPADIPVPADYDGDGKGDLAVYRPGSGTWFIVRSATNATTQTMWGLSGDLPVPGDYDGDGKADLAVYRPSSGVWYIIQSRTSLAATIGLGLSTDIPVPQDYDGDGITDPAVYRPSTGMWFVRKSSTGSTTTLTRQWGLSGDQPVPGDYDGDGIGDLAVWRPSNGVWYLELSSSGLTASAAYQWGLSGDLAVPGDYDGDGKADLAVYRPASGVWYISQSATGYMTSSAVQWGLSNDSPLPTIGVRTAFTAASGQPTLSTLANLVRASDLDGDARGDLTAYRPSNGTWFTLRSIGGYSASSIVQWGFPDDIPAAGDYDGNGTTDVAVYRPSNGTWYVRQPNLTIQWGLSGDIPVPGDYDGDGRTDTAVYRPSSGVWYIRQSSTNYAASTAFQWGLNGDIAVAGDYDGDGLTDLAVYRPSSGTWLVRPSRSGYATSVSYQWGLSGDLPVPGDYDGDGNTDFAVYRPSTGVWFIRRSTSDSTTFSTYQWGLNGDTPVPADFDGDGITDLAVWRPSNGTWYLLKSSGGFSTSSSYQWGLPGDVPIPNSPHP